MQLSFYVKKKNRFFQKNPGEPSLKDKSKHEIAKEFDIPVITLSTILKKKEEILSRFRIGDCTRKPKETELPSVEQATVKWLKQRRDGDARISGPMLQEKAEICAKTLQDMLISEPAMVGFRNSSRGTALFSVKCVERVRM